MARDDFRRGFLYGLASEGLTPSNFGQLLTKAAEEKQAGGLSSLADMAAAGMIGLPVLAGVAGGTGAYYLTKPDYDTNIKAQQEKETINTLRQKTLEINRRLKGPDNAANTGPTAT